MTPEELQKLAQDIKQWGLELGFDQVGICDTDLTSEEPRLQAWLNQGYHGDMEYMSRHGLLRTRPQELHPGTLRVISVRVDYLPPEASLAKTLRQPHKAYISRYALGRDYHKVLRQRLKSLGDRIEQACGVGNSRPFVDSAPLLERPLAAKAGLGWVGKHSLILHRDAGSFFFLGELLVALPLPVDQPLAAECGHCVACMTICPTGAIVEPYTVDARRCISYLTIEHAGAIPEALRPLLGNRIYGCDDCQLICPWNRYARVTALDDFQPRQALHSPDLLTLWSWDESRFLRETEGSAIRRIGHQRWQRNLAVALGNAPYSTAIITALTASQADASPLVREHIDWALAQQHHKREQSTRFLKTERLIRCIDKGMPDHA
ncbi:tRNA epoxyqueuosine(34) reductase QueG [Pseudaeromonas sharmana]|uniref:Epoxyqueuosine reductase n=1 Tax=Pseudaeromonas sharmana TaxID=328412 RepID=A0ABV8CMM5_9GAMM